MLFVVLPCLTHPKCPPFLRNKQELSQLEILCKQLYESADAGIRGQAEKALVSFTESPDCLQKCQYVLERGTVSTVFDSDAFVINADIMIKLFFGSEVFCIKCRT